MKITTMLNGGEDLPAEIETEAGVLISELHAEGWTVFASHYDAKLFGNWYIDLRHKRRTIRLVKDRVQYMVDSSSAEEIKAAGLWRAFDNLEDFRCALLKWAKT